jgi:hypothetical protein
MTDGRKKMFIQFALMGREEEEEKQNHASSSKQ